MRKEFAVLIALVIATASPSLIVDAAVKEPDLSWQNNGGKTFRYKAANETTTKYFRVTITETNDHNMTFTYWRLNASGYLDVFLNMTQNKTRREDVDIDGWYSHMWVNKSILDAGEGVFDFRNFTRTDGPLDAYYRFEEDNGTTVFEFDKIDGFLTKAEYPGYNTTIELLGTYDDADGVVEDQVLDPFEWTCRWADILEQKERTDMWYEEQAINDPDQKFASAAAGACTAFPCKRHAKAEVRLQWGAWAYHGEYRWYLQALDSDRGEPDWTPHPLFIPYWSQSIDRSDEDELRGYANASAEVHDQDIIYPQDPFYEDHASASVSTQC